MAEKITNEAGYIEKADFIKFAQDTKLLDFTARKTGAKIDMGPRKKEENPNEKVKTLILSQNKILFSDVSCVQTICLGSV